MITVKIPYSSAYLEAKLDERRVQGILRPNIDTYISGLTQNQIVERAIANPIQSLPLRELARESNNILLVTSDHTRPLPSNITLPILLHEIRCGNREARIKILIATGCHRPTTYQEMLDKFGKDIVEREEIINHNCKDTDQNVYKGILPSGGELWLNSLVDWADLVISEGLIEPHFFAGFSGGRKSIMPGIAGQNTVLANHNSRFIADVNANTGILNNNPIHRDMLFAAKAARLRFILNVCINSEKEIVQAFAGHPEKAHYEGCEFVKNLLKVRRKESDIVITSNGGYPLDQNIYQAVKGMTAAETCVRKDGVIIMVAGCCDGHGGEAFYNWMTRGKSPEEIMQKILAVPPEQTMADQWQAQILARVLLKARVIMVTDLANKEMVESMHMSYACSLDEAIKQAEAIVGSDSSITVIPDGVGVIVE